MKSIVFGVLLLALLLSGCGSRGAEPMPAPTPTPVPAPTATPVPTADPAEEAERRALLAEADRLVSQYFYDEAVALLAPAAGADEAVARKLAQVEAAKEALVPYEGTIKHIFFHSLIVYPELIFRDKVTPMGGVQRRLFRKGRAGKNPAPALPAGVCALRPQPVLCAGGRQDG